MKVAATRSSCTNLPDAASGSMSVDRGHPLAVRKSLMAKGLSAVSSTGYHHQRALWRARSQGRAQVIENCILAIGSFSAAEKQRPH